MLCVVLKPDLVGKVEGKEILEFSGDARREVGGFRTR